MVMKSLLTSKLGYSATGNYSHDQGYKQLETSLNLLQFLEL
jgi:hypothetical protein